MVAPCIPHALRGATLSLPFGQNASMASPAISFRPDNAQSREPGNHPNKSSPQIPNPQSDIRHPKSDIRNPTSAIPLSPGIKIPILSQKNDFLLNLS